jgi:hypothetical protein
MAERANWFYWDTSVFLSYFNKNPARHADIDAVLNYIRSTNGARLIVTSTFTKVEVSYYEDELKNKQLSPDTEEILDFLRSSLMSHRPARYRATRKKTPTLCDLTPEASVQHTLEQALTLYHWLWWSFPARAYSGSKCPACGTQAPRTGIHPGWPDLVALGPRDALVPRLLAIEVKAHGQTPTTDQDTVLDLFARLGCFSFYDEAPLIESGVCSPSTLDAWLEQIRCMPKR